MSNILTVIALILALIFSIPSILLFPVVVVTLITGFIKKDFHYFKKYIKMWLYSVGGLFGIFILYFLISLVSSFFTQ